MDQIIGILPWLLPPVIGAVIGYITNAIAITMLFRPHYEKRLLGIRIPMTPGIIPKQRYELSESVGSMVSRELLTEDAVRKQIRSSKFTDSVEASLSGFFVSAVESPVGELKDKLKGAALSLEKTEAFDRTFIPELFKNFLGSESGMKIAELILDKGIGVMENQTAGSLLKGRKDRAAGLIPEILFSSEVEIRIRSLLDSRIQKAVHDNYRLSYFLTDNIIDQLCLWFRKIYRRGYPHVLEFLNRDDLKSEFEIHGRKLLVDIINKLNRIQRFLVSAGQYDRTLDEHMPEIVDDVLKRLGQFAEKDENLDKMELYIRNWLTSLSRRTAGEIITGWDGDLFEDLHSLLEILFSFVNSDLFVSALRSWAGAVIDKNSERTVMDLLDSWFGISVNQIKKMVLGKQFGDQDNSSELSGIYRIPARVVSFIIDTVSDNGKKSFSEIVGLTPESAEKSVKGLSSILISVVDDKVPAILRNVDVNTLVVDKINSLDMERVEKIIMDVVRKQLRWINVFGALLGSVIGGAQLLMNMLMR